MTFCDYKRCVRSPAAPCVYIIALYSGIKTLYAMICIVIYALQPILMHFSSIRAIVGQVWCALAFLTSAVEVCALLHCLHLANLLHLHQLASPKWKGTITYSLLTLNVFNIFSFSKTGWRPKFTRRTSWSTFQLYMGNCVWWRIHWRIGKSCLLYARIRVRCCR